MCICVSLARGRLYIRRTVGLSVLDKPEVEAQYSAPLRKHFNTQEKQDVRVIIQRVGLVTAIVVMIYSKITRVVQGKVHVL